MDPQLEDGNETGLTESSDEGSSANMTEDAPIQYIGQTPALPALVGKHEGATTCTYVDEVAISTTTTS